MSLLRYEDGIFVDDAEYDFEPETLAEICGDEEDPQTGEKYIDILLGGTDILLHASKCFVKSNEPPVFLQLGPNRYIIEDGDEDVIFSYKDTDVIRKFYELAGSHEEHEQLVSQLKELYIEAATISSEMKKLADLSLKVLNLKDFYKKEFPVLPIFYTDDIIRINDEIYSILEKLRNDNYDDHLEIDQLEELIESIGKEYKNKKKVRATLSSSEQHVAEELRDRIYRNLNDDE